MLEVSSWRLLLATPNQEQDCRHDQQEEHLDATEEPNTDAEDEELLEEPLWREKASSPDPHPCGSEAEGDGDEAPETTLGNSCSCRMTGVESHDTSPYLQVPECHAT